MSTSLGFCCWIINAQLTEEQTRLATNTLTVQHIRRVDALGQMLRIQICHMFHQTFNFSPRRYSKICRLHFCLAPYHDLVTASQNTESSYCIVMNSAWHVECTVLTKSVKQNDLLKLSQSSVSRYCYVKVISQ